MQEEEEDDRGAAELHLRGEEPRGLPEGDTGRVAMAYGPAEASAKSLPDFWFYFAWQPGKVKKILKIFYTPSKIKISDVPDLCFLKKNLDYGMCQLAKLVTRREGGRRE